MGRRDVLKGSAALTTVGMILDTEATDGLGFKYGPVSVTTIALLYVLSLIGPAKLLIVSFSQVWIAERVIAAWAIEGNFCLAIGWVERLFMSF